MSELFVTAASSTSFELWEELKLESLSLEFVYRAGQKDAKIRAWLSFGTEKDLLCKFTYKGPEVEDLKDVEPIPSPPLDVTAATSNSASWSVTVTYSDKVSILKALSAITNVDIGKELDGVELQDLRKVIDIELSNSAVFLSRAEKETSFAFSADITSDLFSHVDLQCYRSSLWTYFFGFSFNCTNFFETLGIEHLTLTNTTVAVTNNPSPIIPWVGTVARNGNLKVQFAATLTFEGNLADLKTIAKQDCINIVGSIGNKSFSIWVTTDDFPLFEGITLSGQLGVEYFESKLDVGLKGKSTSSRSLFHGLITQRRHCEEYQSS